MKKARAKTAKAKSPYTRRANPLHHVLALEAGVEIRLTERQYQILVLVGGGLTVREVSRRLRLSEQDVNNRLNRLAASTGMDRDKLAWLGARLAHDRTTGAA
jgi:DNA-binding NarL/FixJ family response regulator